MNLFPKIILGFIFLLSYSCQEYGVHLRIENASNVDFEQISVNNVPFGAIKSNGMSNFISFENISDTEFVEVIVDGEAIRVVPEDVRDTEFFSTGNYRYVIDIVHKKWLSVRLIPE